MVSSYLAVIRKYAVTRGRTRRREYWTFTLVNGFAWLLWLITDSFTERGGLGNVLANTIELLIILGTIVPSICVTIRRLQDTGRGKRWLALAFIPLIGTLILAFVLCFDSESGENKFGPNPKEAFASNPLVA